VGLSDLEWGRASINDAGECGAGDRERERASTIDIGGDRDLDCASSTDAGPRDGGRVLPNDDGNDDRGGGNGNELSPRSSELSFEYGGSGEAPKSKPAEMLNRSIKEVMLAVSFHDMRI